MPLCDEYVPDDYEPLTARRLPDADRVRRL